ncbi:MAG: cyclic nucleotide-binding domain-containing protein, partial [Nitrospinae bacterium]|nr:cyclic nucleotide-binding domain-containing protein [Nitrospinota bacterium]
KMYIIVSGSVTITKDMHGKRVDLKKLKEGDCFGELAIIDKMPRSASVIANEPTVVIAINEVVLRTSNPEVCLKLYRNLAAIISEKLRYSDARVYNLLTAGKDVEAAS